MIDAKGRCVIENYNKRSTFASFLPGISGTMGIPIWCYYVNRGQCISCFGTQDKDHSIMEFVPAHQAYLHTARMGFRSFYRDSSKGQCGEAFADAQVPHRMYIDKNTLMIEEEDSAQGLHTQVTYFTLPQENIGALVRKVEMTNTDSCARELELIDGFPALVPYGVAQEPLKNMTQTAKAWMQVEDVEKKVPYFRVRASIEDSTKVSQINGGNFAFAVDEKGELLQAIVDAQAVFSYDTAYSQPRVLIEEGLTGVLAQKQMTLNQFPCCFFAAKTTLAPQQTYTFYEVIGQAADKELLLTQFLNERHDGAYFEQKLDTARELTNQITEAIATKTSQPAFDAYCRQDLLDNVLRGGMPILLGKKEIFYIYARKHGDMERDYNYFKTLAEFYSQGNGNFRDMNQNRRCDAFFFPMVGDRNIHLFYDLIQMDGYNPLGVEKTTYQLSAAQLEQAAAVTGLAKEQLEFLTAPFTPGELCMQLLQKGAAKDKLPDMMEKIVEQAQRLVAYAFLEGYWSDHWTYLLDLVENYLSVWPEQEEKLFFEEENFSYPRPGAGIYPRSQRYVKTPQGIRQYRCVYPITYEEPQDKPLHSTLIAKMILLNAVKFASLDPYGCGIEMEGGKPGWYDALNGLPALCGSSMAETCELARNLEYTIALLSRYPRQIALFSEVAELIEQLYEVVSSQDVEAGAPFLTVWNQLNDRKEAYREKLYRGISGEISLCSCDRLLCILRAFLKIVEQGIEEALRVGNGLIATYFSYEVTAYEEIEEDNEQKGIRALSFSQHVLPHFLEGPVRYLKLKRPEADKEETYRKVRQSGLYDTKLDMYKVNEPLAAESYEVGRCRAFSPGWLENESIWLHMEYKYLLELLKSGLYRHFLDDFHKMAVPFLEEEMYGRSILENSSFIASSANPDEKIHGKGFVARLSGSTVEFMEMWQIMMFGEKPFTCQDNALVLSFRPLLPAYLICRDKTLEATFLGTTRVLYHVAKADQDYMPGSYQVKEYRLYAKDGRVTHVYDACIKGTVAEAVRAGMIERIEAFLE